MIYGGEGLARLSVDATDSSAANQGRGKAVFIPFVLPGEIVDAHLTEESAGFARAQLDHIQSTSRGRVDANCPYFQACGGCQYQHIEYKQQVEIKVEILRETLRRMGGIDLNVKIQTHTASPWAYRNRTRLHLRHTPKFELGYYRFRSNNC